jgi:hypothetical protein
LLLSGGGEYLALLNDSDEIVHEYNPNYPEQLEFEVLSDDKAFFDNFQIIQKMPGRFLNSPGTPGATLLGDLPDWTDGEGSLTFGRG